MGIRAVGDMTVEKIGLMMAGLKKDKTSDPT
jgi:hypothetical protein